MQSGDAEEKRLLETWFDEHLAGNTCSLFIGTEPSYVLAPSAEALMRREFPEGMFLYVVLVRDVSGQVLPLYIGKTKNPVSRWLGGHLIGLNKAKVERQGLYGRWISAFEKCPQNIELMVMHESQVQSAPIPGFPITIGAIEYQLVSLADDAFPGIVLNHEGAAR